MARCVRAEGGGTALIVLVGESSVNPPGRSRCLSVPALASTSSVPAASCSREHGSLGRGLQARKYLERLALNSSREWAILSGVCSASEDSQTRPDVTSFMAKKTKKKGRSLKLRPANSFDLIRLIAYSQSDPRKACAELVQNALDAGARQITVMRMRRRGNPALSILDDGRGVFPEFEREKALEHIASNIGHSFKRNLSPAERQEAMLLGQYGIGILGFWAVGEEFEMRTRVSGSDVWALELKRDDPKAEVIRVPQSRLKIPEDTFTEVTIRNLHQAALRQLTGRRLGEYLGSELRGQLLAREVKLRIVDRLARGTAAKDFLVVPQRFLGERLSDLAELDVAGFSSARLELYLADEEASRRGAVALSCGGTTVADDVGGVEDTGLNQELWSSGRFEGVVEFGDLQVAPTTRRGFFPGPAADALFEALRGLEPKLLELIEVARQKRESEEDDQVVKQLRRIFRPLSRDLPQYDFFDVASGRSGGAEDGSATLGHRESDSETPGAEGDLPEGEELSPGVAHASAPTSEDIELGDEPEPIPEILPPGPLDSVRLSPKRSRLLPGATRTLRARAVDEGGRSITEGVEYRFEIRSGNGSMVSRGPNVQFTAASELGDVRIGVVAIAGEREVSGEAEIEVAPKLQGDSPDAGVPEPSRVYDVEGDWRSRMSGRVWEYNAAHPDYRAVSEDSRSRLRYLTHLFAKEIVLRNYGEPSDEKMLERMVEVLTHIRRGG